MAFGSLVPGMAPMPIPQFRPTNLGAQGMQLLQMARGQQQQGQRPPGGAPPGQPPQGLLQRLLNPGAPPATPGAPTDLAPPGMAPNGMPTNPAQMGLLARLFPGLMGQQPTPPVAGTPAPPMMPPAVEPDAIRGLY